MAAIDTVRLDEYTLDANDAGVIKTLMAGAIWEWYNTHQDTVVFQFLFIKRTVKDLRFIFVALAGESA